MSYIILVVARHIRIVSGDAEAKEFQQKLDQLLPLRQGLVLAQEVVIVMPRFVIHLSVCILVLFSLALIL